MQRLAQSSMQQYASGSHDVNSLSVPGRVFYIRARKINKVYCSRVQRLLSWSLHVTCCVVPVDNCVNKYDALQCRAAQTSISPIMTCDLSCKGRESPARFQRKLEGGHALAAA